MKAQVTLKNIDSAFSKHVIVRSLNRILDIRIIDFDLDNGILHFLCNGQNAFEQVKKERSRIGFPIQDFSYEPPTHNLFVKRYADGTFI